MKLQGSERTVRGTGRTSVPRVSASQPVKPVQRIAARAQERDTDAAPFWEEGLWPSAPAKQL